MKDIKPGDDVRIELRSPVHSSRVYIAGEEVPVAAIEIHASARDAHPMVELHLIRKPWQEPVVVSGTFFAEGFEVSDPNSANPETESA